MMLGRDLCGLPVFSWQQGNYICRVADFFINGKTKRLFPKGKSLFALKPPSFRAKWGRDAFVWFCIRHPTRISDGSHFAGSFQGGGRILSVILPHGRIFSVISARKHFHDASGSGVFFRLLFLFAQ